MRYSILLRQAESKYRGAAKGFCFLFLIRESSVRDTRHPSLPYQGGQGD